MHGKRVAVVKVNNITALVSSQADAGQLSYLDKDQESLKCAADAIGIISGPAHGGHALNDQRPHVRMALDKGLQGPRLAHPNQCGKACCEKGLLLLVRFPPW